MKKLVEVEPLGTEVLLPAIIVGYEVTQPAAEIVRVLPDEVPDWIWLVRQQAGGLCMSYPSVLGGILRLESNREFGDEVPFMVRGLVAMAEDPDLELLGRDYPALASLVKTWGEEYPRASVERLASFLARYIRLPPIASAIEAFVKFEQCNPLDYVECWRMVQHELPVRPESWIITDQTTRVTNIDESNFRELILREDELLSCCHLNALQQMAAAVGQEGPPSLFLLWENSD
jgi:hypothetical protein